MRRGPHSWIVTGVVLAAAAAAGSVHGWGTPPAAEVRLASGTLSLSNSLNEAAILSVQNLKPGESRTGQVTITNTGTLDGAFSLTQSNLADTPGPYGGRLSDGLQLSVEELAAGGSTVSSVYSGAMSGLTTRQLGTIAGGEPRTFRFTASLPDSGHPLSPGVGDNVFQRSAVRADYVWTATADEPGGGGGGSGGGGGNGGGGGSGGGGGWGGGVGPAPGGPFTVQIGGPKRQRPLRKGKLVFTIRCSTVCNVRWTASLMRLRPTRKKRVRMVPLRGGTARSRKPIAMPAGTQRKVSVKLTRKMKRILRTQFRRRRPTYAGIRVFASSGTVKVVARRRIQLKR
jgi:spore coat-associated protein N